MAYGRMAGRPTKYTPERVEVILQAIRDGNTHTCAAALGGVNRLTLLDWQKRYSDFSDAVQKADADAEAAMVAKVQTAAEMPQYWTAAMTWLERRRHEDWGKKDQTPSKSDEELALITRTVKAMMAAKS